MTQRETFDAADNLSPKQRALKIFFMALLLFTLVVCIICTFIAIRWVNRPFPGFLLNQRMVVAPIGQYHWTGSKAGLKYPDKILTANGEAISSIKELEKVIDSSFLGEGIIYGVDRNGSRFQVTVPTMRFSWIDLLMTFGITFIPGITYALIGLSVFFMKPNIKISWTFMAATLFMSLWFITLFDMQSTHFGFIRLYLLSNAFFPAAFAHFSFYFPRPRKFIQRFPRIQIVPYAVSFLLSLPIQIIYPKPGFHIFYTAAIGYSILSTFLVLQSVVQAYFKPGSVLEKQRARVVLWGAAIAFPVPGLAYFFQLVFGSFLGMRVQTNFLAVFLIIFPVSIAYAIIKHNLFDVDVFIKRAVGYALMTAVVVGAYLLVSVFLNVALGQYRIAQSRAFPIIFTLVVILVLNPLRDRIQALVDRIFFRKEYSYSEITEKIGNAMTSLLDLNQILKKLVGTFNNDMFINTSSVMLLNPAASAYQVHLSEGERKQDIANISLDRSNALIDIIERKKSELTKYDVLEGREYQAVSEECGSDFESLQASLLVPLIYQDNVIGLFSLGEKKSGKFYNRQDIDLLNAIANQGAVAIENARLFQENLEKQRMEEELAIGRELQMSMLPAQCPQIDGFEIVAFSESAREVGGDFYDFIEIGEDRLGLVIGDVTGKSVSGALVMSASRSIFRMLGEDRLTVSDSMIRANRRTKKDIKSGMFVALLYAVLGSTEKSMTLCSAGQTQPIFRSAASGETRLVETEGDSFPLGILDEANYEETSLQLNAGDRVVLYTDGVVEAMNGQEELYGFDRLIEVIENSPSKTAELLLEEIKQNVSQFTGDTPQHDDITIIVIQAKEGGRGNAEVGIDD